MRAYRRRTVLEYKNEQTQRSVSSASARRCRPSIVRSSFVRSFVQTSNFKLQTSNLIQTNVDTSFIQRFKMSTLTSDYSGSLCRCMAWRVVSGRGGVKCRARPVMLGRGVSVGECHVVPCCVTPSRVRSGRRAARRGGLVKSIQWWCHSLKLHESFQRNRETEVDPDQKLFGSGCMVP